MNTAPSLIADAVFAGWQECSLEEVPAGSAWLSPAERVVVGRLRFEKRRQDWLLGRWTAKCALQKWPFGGVRQWPLRCVTIDNRPDGSPQILLAGKALQLSLSISHCRRRSLAVLGSPACRIGCDLEWIESRPPCFLETFFTEDEQRLVNSMDPAQRPLATTLIWSLKESALKALRVGLRQDTRQVQVQIETRSDSGGDWQPAAIILPDSKWTAAWWKSCQDYVRTVVGVEPVPVCLADTQAAALQDAG